MAENKPVPSICSKGERPPRLNQFALSRVPLAGTVPWQKRKVSCNFKRSRFNYKILCCYKTRLLHTGIIRPYLLVSENPQCHHD